MTGFYLFLFPKLQNAREFKAARMQKVRDWDTCFGMIKVNLICDVVIQCLVNKHIGL